MKMRLLSGACMASAIITASGAQPAFAASPTRLDHDPNVKDAGIADIHYDTGMTMEPAGGEDLKASKHDSTNVDYGLATMTCLSDDRSARPLGSHGHLADIANDAKSPPAFIAAAGLSATSAAGAFAPS